MSKNTIEVTDATFEQKVLKSKLPVIVDFWAEWCGPCHAMISIVEELALEYKEKVKFAKLNVDENMATAQVYTVMSIPTFILFKEGQPVKRFVGARSITAFKQEIEGCIK